MNGIKRCLTELIGNTPVIEIKHSLVPEGKKLFGKIEAFNPTFSVKDRTALGLIKKAITAGKLKKGDTIIESSSGNLGKSLAMLGAILGFKVIVVIDPKVSQNILNWYKAYGAKVELVDIPDESGGFQKARISRVNELLLQYENTYWPNQYDNHDNIVFHEEYTSLEFDNIDTDIIVGSISTGGHLSGIAKGLKSRMDKKKILACDIVGSTIFGGNFTPYLINGVGLSWIPKNTHKELFDYKLKVSDQDAISMCRSLARSGLLVGGSSGTAVLGALAALEKEDFKSALVILPDTGVNYLDQIYDDSWLEMNGVKLLNDVEIKEKILLYEKEIFD